MYFLAKLCRLCVQSKSDLVALDSEDYDSISFNAKLEVCTQMVLKTEQEVSKEICSSCVYKLRISYEFYNMCRKSTGVLTGYVSKLVGNTSDINSNLESFTNANIVVALTKSPINPRKRRIGKSERCAAIQKLLSQANQEFLPCTNEQCLLTPRSDKPRGGLKDLLSFTKSFDFGYNNNIPEPPTISPLDKLIEFSENFFYKDFASYRQNILCVINEENNNDEFNSNSEDSDIEEMFKPCFEEEEDRKVQESFDAASRIKEEPIDANEADLATNPINYLQICYKYEPSDEPIKKEICEENSILSMERIVQETENQAANTHVLKNNYIFNKNLQKQLEEENQQELTVLSKLTDSGQNRKDFVSKRNNTYINHKLQQQYLFCKFKCDTCNRYFKSHGYLKAHNSKVHSTYK